MGYTKNLIFIISCFSLLVACTKSDDFLDSDSLTLKSKNMNQVQHSNGLDSDRYIYLQETGLKVHYRVIGKGPIDIVFIPGWTNPLEIFTKQFDFFRDKARCIYIDVPGQGLSDSPEGIEYSMGLMADAIYEVVRKEGVKSFVGVGFSMGPVPLGQFHLKYPGMMTHLVNLDGGFNPWPPVGDESRDTYIAQRDGFIAWIETWGVAEKEAFASMLVLDTSPDDLKALLPYFYEFPSWLMANIYRNYTMEEVNQPLGWTFPILSIYSAPPTDMDYEDLYFPGAEIHVMEGSGHVVQWERAEIVNQLIWDFVADAPRTVTVPFKADFTGNYLFADADPFCGDMPWGRVINEGEGTGTHLGRFRSHFDFCCQFSDGTYPGDYMNAFFVSANGDTLFVSCGGQVINGREEDHPEYVVSYFRDPWVITGGTGRFLGATGSGMTDDYNSSLDPYSHHHWEGTITMVKGNPKKNN